MGKSKFSERCVDVTFACKLPTLSPGAHTLNVIAKVHGSELLFCLLLSIFLSISIDTKIEKIREDSLINARLFRLILEERLFLLGQRGKFQGKYFDKLLLLKSLLFLVTFY